MEYDIVVMKKAKLFYLNESLSIDVMVTFNDIYTKLRKYGLEFDVKWLRCS